MRIQFYYRSRLLRICHFIVRGASLLQLAHLVYKVGPGRLRIQTKRTTLSFAFRPKRIFVLSRPYTVIVVMVIPFSPETIYYYDYYYRFSPGRGILRANVPRGHARRGWRTGKGAFAQAVYTAPVGFIFIESACEAVLNNLTIFFFFFFATPLTDYFPNADRFFISA